MPDRPYIVLRRARSGQTLIVAVAVLFILLVIGALFITQIARNLTFAGRSRDTQLADSLARAGVQFCDQQLSYSEEGADWRPVPTAPITSVKDPMGVSDPDYEWLSAGFTRMNMKGGRALVRISYDPNPSDPHSQFLKIEAVGRPGELGTTIDPTVFVQSGAAPRLRRELIAYKQLALTDYLRFITDLDKTHKTASLGVPSIGHYVAMALNDPTTALNPAGINSSHLIIGGGIRCNTDLQLLGDFFFYAGQRGTGDPTLTFEGMQVAGNILLGPTRDVNGDGALNNSDHQAFVMQPINAAPSAANAIIASNDTTTPFDTHGGLIRDGSPNPDVSGYARSIPYLVPPSIDTYVNGSGVLRYRALTRDSGAWVNNGATHYNTGINGWGAGIYVNNPADLQPETLVPGTGGGYSLPRDWTNPQAGYGSNLSRWSGPHYIPPGMLVELMGDRIRLTRFDGQSFTHPDGSPIQGQGATVEDIPLADADRASWTFPDGAVYTLPVLSHDGDDKQFHPNAGQPYGDPNSYGVDVVLFAEGNVRIKGFYGAVTDSRNTSIQHLGRVHITIVTGGTAYIEGNIVKNDGYLDSNGTMIMERNSTCAILAHDYVCVNPTMFMSPQASGAPWSVVPNSNLYATEVGQSSEPTYDTSFSWGVNPNTYTVNGTPLTPYLMLSHSAVNNGPTYFNLLINPPLNGNGNSIYSFLPSNPSNTGPPLANTTGVVGYIYDGTQWISEASGVAPAFDMLGFQLNNTPTGIPFPGYDNILRFQLDQSGSSIPGVTDHEDYYLNSAMVAPLDIRIEALLYAEHRSFFVIPGYYFNEQSTDTRQNYIKNGKRVSVSLNTADTASDIANKDLYPFFGEPMDVRITIYGAVAENYTASQGDQTYWMENWGYIPTHFGSSAQLVPDDHLNVHDPANYNPAEDRTQDFQSPQEVADNITRGLRFEYDPALAMPYGGTVQNGNVILGPTDPNLVNSTPQYRETNALRFIDRPAVVINNNQVLPEIRQTLPPLPRLPVCPGLLYYGDSDRPIT